MSNAEEVYNSDQYIEYGKACRKQALEEAAEVCKAMKLDPKKSLISIHTIEAHNRACTVCNAYLKEMK